MAEGQKIRPVDGKRSKVFVGGCLSAESYGLEMSGMLPAQLQQLKARLGRATGIVKLGWSLEQAWSVRPRTDPVKHCAGLLQQYAKEWWKATSGKSEFTDQVLHPGELVSAFNIARERVNPELPWTQQVHGPLSMMLSVRPGEVDRY